MVGRDKHHRRSDALFRSLRDLLQHIDALAGQCIAQHGIAPLVILRGAEGIEAGGNLRPVLLEQGIAVGLFAELELCRRGCKVQAIEFERNAFDIGIRHVRIGFVVRIKERDIHVQHRTGDVVYLPLQVLCPFALGVLRQPFASRLHGFFQAVGIAVSHHQLHVCIRTCRLAGIRVNQPVQAGNKLIIREAVRFKIVHPPFLEPEFRHFGEQGSLPVLCLLIIIYQPVIQFHARFRLGQVRRTIQGGHLLDSRTGEQVQHIVAEIPLALLARFGHRAELFG